jgi:hypothetical protein
VDGWKLWKEAENDSLSWKMKGWLVSVRMWGQRTRFACKHACCLIQCGCIRLLKEDMGKFVAEWMVVAFYLRG